MRLFSVKLEKRFISVRSNLWNEVSLHVDIFGLNCFLPHCFFKVYKAKEVRISNTMKVTERIRARNLEEELLEGGEVLAKQFERLSLWL